MSDDVERVPVDFNYEAVNPTFLKMLARIASYAAEKYGSWEQYTRARLVGEKSPINHAYEHVRCYVAGESYDKFDGDPKWHLAAAAYNLMMEFFYASKFGRVVHPLLDIKPIEELRRRAVPVMSASEVERVDDHTVKRKRTRR